LEVGVGRATGHRWPEFRIQPFDILHSVTNCLQFCS
jgi:hypothetical protein